jgi:large subunit ribosomal protein L21
MKSAVIKTGGKQYIVKEGDVVSVEQLPVEEGKKIVFEEILMTAEGDDVKLGDPLLKGGKVEGKIVRHGQHDKVYGVHMKAKKRLKKYFGHRQHFTEVEITKIA